jgi:hypothetical protein
MHRDQVLNLGWPGVGGGTVRTCLLLLQVLSRRRLAS